MNTKCLTYLVLLLSLSLVYPQASLWPQNGSDIDDEDIYDEDVDDKKEEKKKSNDNENEVIEGDISASGYGGFYARMQGGIGYTTLSEIYPNTDDSIEYFGAGYYFAGQFGFSMSRYLTFFLHADIFSSNSLEKEGSNIQSSGTLGPASNNYSLFSSGIGMTFFYIANALSFSPILYLSSRGVRLSSQTENNESASLKHEQRIKYSPQNSLGGYGIIVSNDEWINKKFGVGFSFALYQNLLKIEEARYTITQTESLQSQLIETIEYDNTEATNLIFSMAVNMVFN